MIAGASSRDAATGSHLLLPSRPLAQLITHATRRPYKMPLAFRASQRSHAPPLPVTTNIAIYYAWLHYTAL